MKNVVIDKLVAQVEGVEYSESYSPTSNWALAGIIIERENLTMQKDVEDYSTEDEPWYSECGSSYDIGATPLIAAMRAYVRQKLDMNNVNAIPGDE